MKNALITIFVIIFLLSSCKKNEKDDKSLFYLLLYGLNQNVSFSGKFGGIFSSNSKSIKALPDGITDVLAISASNHYQRSKVDQNGNFSLPLVKGYIYILIFIDISNNIKGYYKIDDLSLSTIPTHYAGNSINGGEIEKSNSDNYTPVRNFNVNEFLNQSGNLSGTEISSLALTGLQMKNLLNIDSDGNGIIDLEEGLFVRASFSQAWGSPNDSRFSISSVSNQFFDVSILKGLSTNHGFAFTIDASKVLNSNIEISYPIPTGCSDQNNGTLSTKFTDNPGLIPRPPILFSKGISARMAYAFNNFNCNGVNRVLPADGTYTIKNSGKTYTFNNLKPFYMDTTSTFILPTVKFNVQGDTIQSIDYQFKKISPNEVTTANDREINMVYGNSPWQAGLICRDTVNGFPFAFSCFIPLTSQGTISSCQTGSNVKLFSPNGSSISRYKDCSIYIYDVYGTNLSIGLY